MKLRFFKANNFPSPASSPYSPCRRGGNPAAAVGALHRGVGRNEIEADPGLPRRHPDRVRLAVDAVGKEQGDLELVSPAGREVGEAGDFAAFDNL